ncbi:carboxy-S-adenosyl-L-methionine synthase CmoA [Aurantivibrio plasticivorans]
MTQRDTIYSNPLSAVAGFEFNDDVVKVFPDMIQRSVPGYESIVSMIGDLAQRYAQPNSKCVDLGCSLGASSLAMAGRIDQADCEIIGVDNSPAMVERFTAILNAHPPRTPVNVVLGDVRSTNIDNASVVVLNFTLQFIPVAERDQLIKNIYHGMNPGGVLIVSEKVSFEDQAHQELMIELHHNFKRANGYSDLEIAQKRSSLENVLIPETLAQHRKRFQQAGFSSSDVWFQCLNFASMLAIK